MASSSAHKFGQVIGEVLESVVLPKLMAFCDSEGLYLDFQKRDRPARRGRKVTWRDQFGNAHNLDFVIERMGTDHRIGDPIAFIEVAWRRYTRHSRNKAQEIQGAILPLAEQYKWNSPFLGTVVAGIFTEGALTQLRSLGFHVLYFPYPQIVTALASIGIDVHFDEETPDSEFQRAADQIDSDSDAVIAHLRNSLMESNRVAIDEFFLALKKRLSRAIDIVTIIPLYGHANDFYSIAAAAEFLERHSIYEGSGEFRKYEIRVAFSNGDRVEASMNSKDRAREFLEQVGRT